ncbi:MAG: SDR family NAD(P)-dependent oxidoreductase, partial [Planctomycetota bacterium]
MRLKDKVAVVTGSSTGIGRAVAERFAQEGADVVVNYNSSAEKAQECLEAIEAAGRRGLVVQANMADVAAVRGLIDQTIDTFGRIDVLVANAGVEKETPFLEIEEDLYDWILDINLKGAFFASQQAARHMVKRFDAEGVGGRIIFMSSVHEEIPFPLHAAYCASNFSTGSSDSTVMSSAEKYCIAYTPTGNPFKSRRPEIVVVSSSIATDRIRESNGFTKYVFFAAGLIALGAAVVNVGAGVLYIVRLSYETSSRR